MGQQVFIVWRGHRDSEENVVVCETRELAEGVLEKNGARRGNNEHFPDEVWDASPNSVPWGIEECSFLSSSAADRHRESAG